MTSNRIASSLLLRPIHERLRGWILDTISTRDKFGVNYDEPVGDTGLFGPDSVTWKIHADFPGMMSGGIAALMMQTLHPRALAGVWDHSRFREDPLGRLKNTTTFVAATSYAPTADAERLIAWVNRIHEHVVGQTAEGEPYDARDPELLTWVHCTEMTMFLEGYKRFRRADLAPDIEDRYFDETRCIAEKLGATNVPATRAGMDEYFRAVQPALRFDQRSRDTLAVLENMQLPIPMASFSRRTFLGAGAALLPEWVLAQMARNHRQRLADRSAALALKSAAPMIRAAMSEGISWRSAKRCGVGREALRFD